MPLTSGIRLGSYEITGLLGAGGMGEVYRARDTRLDREVAVKVLRPDVASAIGPERFLREIEIVARLTHPHILPLHDSGEAEGRLYYVTPYIEGESLRDRITQERQLPLEDAIRIAREIAGALGYAHAQGFIHRDIKPENVLLSDGLALVADFGLARTARADPASGLTTAGAAMGTPAYMAPEQVTGSASLDGRADLYSLGCLLFEMLAGAPPFTGPAESLAYQHLTVTPRPVSELRPGVPPGVTGTIEKALAKAPADRFASAARFAEALATSMLEPPMGAERRARAPHNLPAERTSFVGRDKELAECRRILDETRLLTLTGIGGCGKSRLALRVAETCLDSYPDGVWFVDLAPLTDESRVAETIATALGVGDQPGTTVLDGLRRHVREKKQLLLLDNCEHLLSACARVVDALMDSGVQVLLTSREGLGITGERLLAVSPLAVPPPEAARELSRMEAFDAVRLFVERARLTQAGFLLTPQNAEAIVEICRRLDGIPLAIELAAARVRILSVDQIRARLDDRFRLLTGTGRAALPRHQTLRATIQWSYDQLEPEEQRLLRELSVFAGGWTLEAAAHLVGESWDEFQVMDLLHRLVDKSLLNVERVGEAEPRYGMLETVRQYAHERLVEEGEAEAARERHLSEFLSLAERAYAERIVRELHWSQVLEREHGNLRAALAQARAVDPERHLALSGALAWFWQGRSHLHEGREHLTTALEGAALAPARPARARALVGAAGVLAWQGDAALAQRRLEEGLRIWRELREMDEVALTIEAVGWAAFSGGDDHAALAAFEEAVKIQAESGNPVLLNRAKVGLGQVLSGLHQIERVRPMAREIISFSSSIADVRSEHLGWHYLADAALIEGSCEESLGLYQKSLALALEIGDRVETSFEVQGVGMSLAGLGRPAEALRLAGAARAEWTRVGAEPHVRFWDELMERYFGGARAALGPAESEAHWERGLRLAFDEAVDIALAATAEAAT